MDWMKIVMAAFQVAPGLIASVAHTKQSNESKAQKVTDYVNLGLQTFGTVAPDQLNKVQGSPEFQAALRTAQDYTHYAGKVAEAVAAGAAVPAPPAPTAPDAAPKPNTIIWGD